MTKYKLLSYKWLFFIPFGAGEYKTVYELTYEKTFFFWFKSIVTEQVSLSMFQDREEFKAKLDKLIKGEEV